MLLKNFKTQLFPLTL